MKLTPDAVTHLPEDVRIRLENLQHEIETILNAAQQLLVTQLPGPIGFHYQSSAPRDILTVSERAQSVSFIARYEHLPTEITAHLEEREGKWFIANYWFLRHVLNDFRPLIQNQSDAVYFQRIHNVWYGMFQRNDPSKGMMARAMMEPNTDVTATWCKWLGERNRAIKFVLDRLEYDYLYNGILQHSDETFSQRFLDEYTSGHLNYIFIKHVNALSFIGEMLLPYYRMMNFLTFPKLGPL